MISTLVLLVGLAASGAWAIKAADVEVDETRTCADMPCANGGTCMPNGKHFHCSCPIGYFGKTCEGSMPCERSPCHNGGRCTNIDSKRFQCACKLNYVGDHCETELPCLNNPCKMNGTCTNINVNNFKCTCYGNYYGDRCEKYMPCHYNPCRNGGSCENVDTENFRCVCPSGKTGSTCESQMDCQHSNRNLTSYGLVVRQISSYNTYQYTVGGITYCDCQLGYYQKSSGCKVKCGADGRWMPYSYSYGCSRGSCGTPPSVTNANRSYNSTYYGSMVTYTCSEGYEMQGVSQMTCNTTSTSSRSSSSFKWRSTSGVQPFCTRRTTCGEPPAVDNASLVQVNGTKKYDEAEYRCEKGSYMVGEGKSRCMCLGSKSVRVPQTTTRYSYSPRYTYVTEEILSWVWVPRCEKACPVPTPTPGPRPTALVYVTSCTATDTRRYPEERCEPPVVYGVHANQSEAGDVMVFNGDELCVSQDVMREKYTTGDASVSYRRLHETNSTACESFCMPGVNGFKRLMVEEAVRSSVSSTEVQITRKYRKYHTRE